MQAHTPSFRFTLRVYWEDTDAGGVVFYTNYLKYFERARTEYLRHLGVAQQVMREATGAIFVVADTQVRYLQPARLDDEIEVTVDLRRSGGASIDFVQQALRAGTLLAEGSIRVGCVDAGTFRPRRIPTPVLERLPAIAA